MARNRPLSIGAAENPMNEGFDQINLICPVVYQCYNG